METSAINNSLFRSRRYRSIGGVCSGIALTRGYSILLTRVVTLLLCSASGIGLIAYLLGWALIPEVAEGQEPTAKFDPFRRDTRNKMIAGVCAGISKMLGIDLALVRIFFGLALVLGGVGIVPYIYAWVAVPPQDEV